MERPHALGDGKATMLHEWTCNGCMHKAMGTPAKLVIPMAGQVQASGPMSQANPVILRFCSRCEPCVEVQNATVVVPKDGRIVPLRDSPPEEEKTEEAVCPACGGEGMVDLGEPQTPKTPCEKCGGEGRIEVAAG